MTFIMSINGTLQLFDESVNLTKGELCQYDYYHVTLCIQHMFYQCAKLWICGSHVIFDLYHGSDPCIYQLESR